MVSWLRYLSTIVTIPMAVGEGLSVSRQTIRWILEQACLLIVVVEYQMIARFFHSIGRQSHAIIIYFLRLCETILLATALHGKWKVII